MQLNCNENKKKLFNSFFGGEISVDFLIKLTLNIQSMSVCNKDLTLKSSTTKKCYIGGRERPTKFLCNTPCLGPNRATIFFYCSSIWTLERNVA